MIYIISDEIFVAKNKNTNTNVNDHNNDDAYDDYLNDNNKFYYIIYQKQKYIIYSSEANTLTLQEWWFATK